ncbi:MAG TPA: glycosyltransferase family 4 protein [Geomonas sp.]|nr:glycosyltransferase family 4 protein [Geomonas sp.]
MKILFVSLFLPQEKAYHAGGRYVFELLRNLSQRHEIHLVTRFEQGEEASLAELAPYCAKIHPYRYRSIPNRNLFGKLLLIANYLGFSRHADWLVQTGHYDLVQVEWVETAILIGKGKAPMVLDAHDVISKPARRSYLRATGWRRSVQFLKYALVRVLEKSIMRRFDRIFTMSEFDRNFLAEIHPPLPVTTVPIPAGLDLKPSVYPRQKNTLLFLASYKYRPTNVEAALYFHREVLPLVRKEVPEARFVIAGYGPPPFLTELAEKDPGVTVTGFVEDTDELYKTAAVFVAPILIGGGIIVKVLDALAAGAPVVTTGFGNEGIGAVDGRDLLVADTPQEFAKKVLEILKDGELAARLSENGERFARENFGLEAVVGKIEAAYGELLKG